MKRKMNIKTLSISLSAFIVFLIVLFLFLPKQNSNKSNLEPIMDIEMNNQKGQIEKINFDPNDKVEKIQLINSKKYDKEDQILDLTISYKENNFVNINIESSFSVYKTKLGYTHEGGFYREEISKNLNYHISS